MCKQGTVVLYVDYSFRYLRLYSNQKAEYKFSSNFSEEQKYHLNKTVTLSLSIHGDGGLWK